VNEIFRISEASLRTRRRALAFVPFIALCVVAVQFYRSPQHPLESVLVAAIVVGISLVVAIRQYKEFSKFAEAHSLAICDEFMLFRDGDVESRVPYGCIEQLTLSGTLKEARTVTVKCRGVPDQLLYGYDQFPRVVDLLLGKVPHAKVRTRGLFTYNNAFKGRRA
jgi:hypothetical protein